MIKNRWNIVEPALNTLEIKPECLDCVLVPLLAFDEKGTRLGYGKGYYDRTFDFLAENSAQKPFLIGLAYSWQYCEALPIAAWDIPLYKVISA